MGVVEIEETEGEDHGFHLNDLKCEKARDLIKHLADFFNGDMPPLIWFDLIVGSCSWEKSENIVSFVLLLFNFLSFKICCFWFVSVRLSSRKALSSLVTCVVCTNNNIVFLFKKWDRVFGSYIYMCMCEYKQSYIHWNYLLIFKNFTNF